MQPWLPYRSETNVRGAITRQSRSTKSLGHKSMGDVNYPSSGSRAWEKLVRRHLYATYRLVIPDPAVDDCLQKYDIPGTSFELIPRGGERGV